MRFYSTTWTTCRLHIFTSMHFFEFRRVRLWTCTLRRGGEGEVNQLLRRPHAAGKKKKAWRDERADGLQSITNALMNTGLGAQGWELPLGCHLSNLISILKLPRYLRCMCTSPLKPHTNYWNQIRALLCIIKSNLFFCHFSSHVQDFLVNKELN